jgi:hypothetical protein
LSARETCGHQSDFRLSLPFKLKIDVGASHESSAFNKGARRNQEKSVYVNVTGNTGYKKKFNSY